MSRKRDDKSYFTIMISGILYGIYRSGPSEWSTAQPRVDAWWWEILEPVNINTDMNAKTHSNITSLIDLLNKTPDYGGLSPQEFVGHIIKGMRDNGK